MPRAAEAPPARALPRPGALVRQGMALFLGRIAALAFSFLVPVVIVRLVDAEAFGVYRQLWLIHDTAVQFIPFGLPAGLMYFAVRNPQHRAAYVTHGMAVLLALGVLTAAVLIGERDVLAAWMNSPALAADLPWLALVLAGSLVAAGFETTLIATKRTALAGTLRAVFESTRAGGIIGGAAISATVKGAMIGACLWAALRGATVVTVFRRHRLLGRRALDVARLRELVVYAAPVGLAVMLVTFSEAGPFYWVSSHFGVLEFAAFSVGFMQIPIVNILFQSTSDVVLVRITELRAAGSLDPALGLLRQATLSLCRMIIPLFAVVSLLAHDIVVLLYTEKFAASASILRIAAFTMVLMSVRLDYVPRAFADTDFIVKVNVLRAICTIVFVGLATPFGLRAVALACVLGMAVSRTIVIARVAALFGVGVGEVLPWTGILRVAAISAGAAGVAWAAAAWLDVTGVLRMLLVGGVFGALYVGSVPELRDALSRLAEGRLAVARWRS
jgi:O-antigen/teichoic acid export membrane protein